MSCHPLRTVAIDVFVLFFSSGLLSFVLLVSFSAVERAKKNHFQLIQTTIDIIRMMSQSYVAQNGRGISREKIPNKRPTISRLQSKMFWKMWIASKTSHQKNKQKKAFMYHSSSWIIDKRSIFWQSVVPFQEGKKDRMNSFFFTCVCVYVFFYITTKEKMPKQENYLLSTNILHQLILYAFFSVACRTLLYGSTLWLCNYAYCEGRRLRPERFCGLYVSEAAIVYLLLHLPQFWWKTVNRKKQAERADSPIRSE